MYLDELRSFRSWMVYHTGVPELQALNLLGVQFALCEAWLFCYANPNYLHFYLFSSYLPEIALACQDHPQE